MIVAHTWERQVLADLIGHYMQRAATGERVIK